MSERVKANINPEMLQWARRVAGLSIEEAAKKAGVVPARLQSWEQKEDNKPTIRQLRLLGKAYKRPIAVFYLPSPPKDFSPMRDFRRFFEGHPREESPSLKYAIRQAWERREFALELYADLEEEPSRIDFQARKGEDPEALAGRVRQFLRVSLKDQQKLKTGYEALNWWREALERVGVLVFQVSRIATREMRGFSICESPLPVIVVNSKDSERGRVFSMIHELVHILLHDGGLCDMTEEAHPHPHDQEIEIFCNRVAGAVLVPKDALLADECVQGKGLNAEWTDQELARLQNRFQASREAILRRLLILGRTTRDFYELKKRQYEEEYKKFIKEKKGGPVPEHRKVISNVGRHMVHLVFDNYYQEKITTSDLSDFLNVKLKHLGAIEREVMGHAAAFAGASS